MEQTTESSPAAGNILSSQHGKRASCPNFESFGDIVSSGDEVDQSKESNTKLSSMEYLVDLKRRLEKGMKLRSYSEGFKRYTKAFSGSQLVEYLLSNSEVSTIEEAIDLGHTLYRATIIAHITKSHYFANNPNLFYQFNRHFNRKKRQSMVIGNDLTALQSQSQQTIGDNALPPNNTNMSGKVSDSTVPTHNSTLTLSNLSSQLNMNRKQTLVSKSRSKTASFVHELLSPRPERGSFSPIHKRSAAKAHSEQELETITKALKISLDVRDRVEKGVTYTNCFIAQHAVRWTVSNFEITRAGSVSEGVDLGNELLEKMYIQELLVLCGTRPEIDSKAPKHRKFASTSAVPTSNGSSSKHASRGTIDLDQELSSMGTPITSILEHSQSVQQTSLFSSSRAITSNNHEAWDRTSSVSSYASEESDRKSLSISDDGSLSKPSLQGQTHSLPTSITSPNHQQSNMDDCIPVSRGFRNEISLFQFVETRPDFLLLNTFTPERCIEVCRTISRIPTLYRLNHGRKLKSSAQSVVATQLAKQFLKAGIVETFVDAVALGNRMVDFGILVPTANVAPSESQNKNKSNKKRGSHAMVGRRKPKGSTRAGSAPIKSMSARLKDDPNRQFSFDKYFLNNDTLYEIQLAPMQTDKIDDFLNAESLTMEHNLRMMARPETTDEKTEETEDNEQNDDSVEQKQGILVVLSPLAQPSSDSLIDEELSRKLSMYSDGFERLYDHQTSIDPSHFTTNGSSLLSIDPTPNPIMAVSEGELLRLSTNDLLSSPHVTAMPELPPESDNESQSDSENEIIDTPSLPTISIATNLAIEQSQSIKKRSSVNLDTTEAESDTEVKAEIPIDCDLIIGEFVESIYDTMDAPTSVPIATDAAADRNTLTDAPLTLASMEIYTQLRIGDKNDDDADLCSDCGSSHCECDDSMPPTKDTTTVAVTMTAKSTFVKPLLTRTRSGAALTAADNDDDDDPETVDID